MKRATLLLFLSCLLLFNCEGEKSYLGVWKCMNADEEKFEIEFLADQMKIIKHKRIIIEGSYQQYEKLVKKGEKTYAIQGEKIGKWLIHFSDRIDPENGLIFDGNNNVICTISRTNYLPLEKVSY